MLKKVIDNNLLLEKNNYQPITIGRLNKATLKDTVKLKGIGLHTGNESKIKIYPANVNTGIVFRSIKKEKGEIQVTPWNVKNTRNAVSISNGIWEIHTIEHLLFAFAIAGITDAYVELSSNEIPILDGSSKEFYEAIQSAQIFEFSNYQNVPIKLVNPVWVVSEDKYIIAVPSDEFKITYTIDYEHPDLKGRSLHIKLNSKVAEKEILSARTFGFLKDVEYLRSQGLIKGASLDNALVLTENGYLNERRYIDECIRHKVLDLVGDLYLLGKPLIAHIIAYRSGHSLDIALAKNILKNLENDELAKLRYY